MKTSDASSHVQALKSSSLIGGSTAIVMLIRMVRTKVIAVLLGPGGVGIEAILDSVASLSRTLFDLGVSSSGVRQVAAAVGSGNEHAIAQQTVFALRRVCFVLGVVGAATLFLSRHVVSRVAFGSAEHASSIGLLAIILMLGAVTGGQGALLQGMRRIGDLARVNIIGTLASVVVTVPIVMIWGVAGIPLLHGARGWRGRTYLVDSCPARPCRARLTLVQRGVARGDGAAPASGWLSWHRR